jgi:hypothetical protein
VIVLWQSWAALVFFAEEIYEFRTQKKIFERLNGRNCLKFKGDRELGQKKHQFLLEIGADGNYPGTAI